MDLITWSDLPVSVCRLEYPSILYAIEDMFRVSNIIAHVMSTESNERSVRLRRILDD
jgi:hypothetical protein